MSLEIDGRVIATAEFREHAAADGCGAWIVSCHPGRLFSRNQAITAMVLAERLAAGFGDDDPFVVCARRVSRAGGSAPSSTSRIARLSATDALPMPGKIQRALPPLSAGSTQSTGVVSSRSK